MDASEIVHWLTVSALLALGPAQPPASGDVGAPPLQARFIGQMAFAITDGVRTIVTDFPYQSGYQGSMTYALGELRVELPATLALITHRHPDHWEPSLFLRTPWRVAGPHDVTSGIPADRVLGLAGRTRFGPVEIEAIETPHALVGHYSYVVTWHGRRLYFSGDTQEPRSLLAARRLDAAFVSPWLYRSVMRGRARIDAKRIVIYHHEAGDRIPGCEDGCVVPGQGDKLSIP
jgi:L-ascorbate metabolism protein UlaG (beta-lactamase superfamily)